jgi:hypothetical protein
MNKHYTTLLPAVAILFISLSQSFACGYAWISDCSSQVNLQINGVQDSFNTARCPYGYPLDGTQLGNIQSLALVNASAITWESCQNNVSAVFLKYRIYEQGFPASPWQTLSLSQFKQNIEGPYTTRYRHSPVNISLSNGLIIGKSYILELYFQAEIDTLGDDFLPETSIFQNNSGANYKLGFIYGGATAPPLSLLAHPTPPSCNGGNDGKLSVSTYGNLSGVFYQWSNINLNFFQQSSLAAGTYGITVSNSLGHSASQNIQLNQPEPLQAFFSNIQSVGCQNSPGSATVTPQGGTPPYTYSWQNGQQGPTAQFLTGGNWGLTVTDAHNCSTSTSVNIGSSAQIERSILADICAGSSYQIGGQQYNQAGNYTLFLPGNSGCDTTIHLTINVLTPIELLTSVPDVTSLSCANPQTNLCAVQNPAVTYRWTLNSNTVANSPCLSVSTGGDYVLTVNWNGCMAEKNVSVSEHFFTPDANIIGSIQSNCNGFMPSWLSIQTNAYQPTFQWYYQGMLLSTNDSCLFLVNEWQGTVPVLPVVVVTDAYGCSNNNPLNSTQLLEYPVFSLTTFSTDCSSVSSQDGSASVAIAGGEAPFSILWNNGATTQVINNLSPGNYCVTVVDNFACSSTQCVQVLYPLQTQSPDRQILKLWPNPARPGDWIHLKLPQFSTENNCKVELFDAMGRNYGLLSSRINQSNECKILLPQPLPPGLYQVRLITSDKMLSTWLHSQ